MATIIEVIPFAVFNRRAPIVAAVRVAKGPLVRQMTVTVSGTQKVLGVIVNIQKDGQEVLEGVVGEVYAVKIEAVEGCDNSLDTGELTLVCAL